MELDVPALATGGRLSVLVARSCQKRTRALAAAREQKRGKISGSGCSARAQELQSCYQWLQMGGMECVSDGCAWGNAHMRWWRIGR